MDHPYHPVLQTSYRTSLRSGPESSCQVICGLGEQFQRSSHGIQRTEGWGRHGRWWTRGCPVSPAFQGIEQGEMCSDSVSLMMVQAERVIWKQQTRRGKERDRLKLGGECGLALKSGRMLLQIEWKKGCGKLRKEMWLEEIRAEWVHPQAVCLFFPPPV